MLLDSLKRLARTAVELLQRRLELLSRDVEDAKVRFLSILLLGAVALLCLALGLVTGTLWLVVAFWDTHRMLVLGSLTGAFLGGGLLALAALGWRARRGPRLFDGTLAELEKDRDALGRGR
jgi:uncharacterized membrane protein YqjE